MTEERSQLSHSIGASVKAARKRQGWSLRKLGEAADVSASLISQIENGQINPSVRSLHSLAEALKVPVDQFFPSDTQQDKEENGRSKPSLTSDMTPSEIRTLHDGVPELDKLSSVLENDIVLHPDERAVIQLLGGVTWSRLTKSAEPNIEFMKTRYDVGAKSGEKMSHHAGREFGLVLSGELTVELGFDRYVLSPGDTIIFDSSRPHRLSNNGTVPAESIWVIWE